MSSPTPDVLLDIEDAVMRKFTAVLRRTADDPAEMRALVEFAGASDPESMVRAMARLFEIGVADYDESDPDWQLLTRLAAARRAEIGDTSA